MCTRSPRARPFRAPHHSITAAGLLGGASRGSIGEVVLAHNGVLFLDELSEFTRPTLEALRQPLEDGRVAIARARHSAVYPARFILLAATNPCPCGYAGEVDRCSCSEADMARHQRRLSGPLLDRIDLLAGLQRDRTARSARAFPDELPAGTRAGRGGARAPGAPPRQRGRDGQRAHGCAHAGAYVRLDERCQEMLGAARQRGLLSARGEHRVLRVARTIADLNASERVRASDLGAALALRPDVGLAGARAA